MSTGEIQLHYLVESKLHGLTLVCYLFTYGCTLSKQNIILPIIPLLLKPLSCHSFSNNVLEYVCHRVYSCYVKPRVCEYKHMFEYGS